MCIRRYKQMLKPTLTLTCGSDSERCCLLFLLQYLLLGTIYSSCLTYTQSCLHHHHHHQIFSDESFTQIDQLVLTLDPKLIWNKKCTKHTHTLIMTILCVTLSSWTKKRSSSRTPPRWTLPATSVSCLHMRAASPCTRRWWGRVLIVRFWWKRMRLGSSWLKPPEMRPGLHRTDCERVCKRGVLI